MTSHVERALSCQLADYFAANIPYPVQWAHIPNGELRQKKTAALLKRMGTKSGWADYQIVYEGRVYFVELKRPRVLKKDGGKYQAAGTLSDEQEAFRDACIANSTPYAVCHSLADVEAMLVMWGIPLKGRITA
jgi:hypothetical protein